MAERPVEKRGFSSGRRAFEKMVREAIESLPEDLQERLENVAVFVEEDASDMAGEWEDNESHILGLYHGVSRKERGFWYGNVLPDRIIIYRRPLERISSNLQELKENIYQTVIHEVGHYFGFDEKELRRLENGNL